ncbi:hypothetical protein BBO99_00002346 [Phytophthora kernoviae]|uniref:VTT domain-containing protein n=2 Tax=Phytophthora kernoviae TaxID=325452 RepID=A0A3R7IKX9_9STRA|nr:hypothetical protein G195_002840 [Phytophthora kernoviae 00238/432]KAG2529543.1 hypothetical protein JM16_002019 [Phytophthora kernoviae]KAG2530448.1 hypothetical protein JM18_002124 [Phytophthora kernoviae]RLN31329.1 hypothetical protein BBI17_002282 [Phytophthora kernoviae]RLN83155.1 hypothetical protein BBO99_00002346 [Phytophthora kernoviae]
MAWIQANPTMGAMLLPLILCVGIPLCIPSPGFEILAGSMFGIVYGSLLCVVGKTAGQLIAFALAKRFGKDRINGYMQTNFPAFAALATVLQNSSWKPLLLIQVANMPHLVKCYGLAIADISTYRFAVSSAVGGLPYAILWAYIGYHSKGLVIGSDENEVNQLQETSFRQRMVIGVGGAVFTVVGMWWLVVYTKKQLHSELQRATKHLHRSSEDSDDTCITISSSDDDDEVERQLQQYHQQMREMQTRLEATEHQNRLLKAALGEVDTYRHQAETQQLVIEELQSQVKQLRITNYRLQYVVQQNEPRGQGNHLPPPPPDIF